MFKSLEIIFVIFLFVVTVKCLNEIRPSIDTIIFDDDLPFDTVQNRVTATAEVCIPILECPSILVNVRNGLYNHTVCGYSGITQLVLCPSKDMANLDIENNVECRISNSNATGFMKYLVDCPELIGRAASLERKKLCDYEICSDLVCCPVNLEHRLKKVCREVDHPEHRLRAQLYFKAKPCTIKELNVTGRYQETCNFADRHPHLKSILKNVCNDEICKDWYCCPIENGDRYECYSGGYCNILKPIVTYGPKCVDSRTGRQGTCKTRDGCYQSTFDRSYIDDATIPFDRCGSYCCTEFICCPDIIDIPIGIETSAANRECSSNTHFTREEVRVTLNVDTSNYNVACNVVNAAGGLEVSPGEFPHMAALGYEIHNRILWNCGGSLISDRFVLTAAHCLSTPEFGIVKKVQLGVVDLLNSYDTDDCPVEYNVAQIIPYPEYNHRFVYNDIGLVKLDGEVIFNFHVRPICLPSNSDLPLEYKSMGWGALGPAAGKSEKLIKIKQELFPYDKCFRLYSYNSNRRLNRGILNETQMCAGSRDTIQSTCAGDSGGPLLANHPIYPRLFTIYGIVSFGTVCGFVNNPGIYTKVFPYVKWIEEIVWS